MSVRNLLFSQKLPLLNRALDTYALREKTIAKNIANATTPNYRPEIVKFEEQLQQAQKSSGQGEQTDGRHIPLGASNLADVRGEATDASVPKPEVLFAGDSHVNIDKEMSQLAQNQIRFRFASRMTARYFKSLQSAIKGTNE